MRIISEKTNKEYATVEECVAAEKKFDEELAAKRAAEEKALAERRAAEEKALAERKAKQESLMNERKTAANEVEVARQELIAAQKKYRDVLSKFCARFGPYHYSIKPGEGIHDLFSSVFDSFWL